MKQTQRTVFSKPAGAEENRIAEQAIVWFSKTRSGALTPQENARFQHWKKQSPVNERAYREVSQLWHDDDFVQALSVTGLSYTTPPNRRRRPDVYRIFRYSLGIAACLGIWLLVADPVVRFRADYYTPVGKQQTIHLSDGSNVTLNTDTAITVAINHEQRYVRLLKGEAYFDVSPDAGKPFTVDSGETGTQVLGTRFIVRDSPDGDQVTVLEGLVKVSNAAQQQSAFLHPGEQVGNSGGGLTAIRHIAVHRDFSWIKGRLTFQDETLAHVVNEIGRYLPGYVLISDAALKSYRINARLDISQPLLAFDTLQETLPVKVTHISAWLTIISRR